MTLALRYTVGSDVGLIREGNEDSAYAGPHLLAIADGMGGHAAGEVASAVAIATLVPLDADTNGVDMLQSLADAITQANATLREITLSDPSTEGMGTTLTAMLWSGSEIALCHIGDSRAYLLRDGLLHQVTHDHTLVQSLVDEGRLTPEAAASHPHRSLVMRALQSSVPADPDLTMLAASAGDRYLLCSDGLSDVVSDETIRKTLAQLPDLDEAVAQLIDLAIRSGGPDNITCVLADVIDTDSDPVPPSDRVIIVGALIGGDNGEASQPVRSDSPASRAHLLSRGATQPGDTGRLSSEDTDVDDSENADDPGPGDDGEARAGSGPRRWPIVTFTLIVLLMVVGAGGYAGWRITQNEFFVGAAGGRVVVFRGVNEAVAGLRLSSVVQQTNIPLADVPAAEAGQIQATISAESLREAQQIVSRIRQDYRCSLVQVDIQRWAANQPKPAPAPKPSRTAGKSRAKTPTARAAASKRPAASKHVTLKSSSPAQPAYPPKPVMPIYCTAFLGDAG